MPLRAGLRLAGIALGFGVLLGAASPRDGMAQVISSNIAVSLGATKTAGLSISILSGSVQSIAALADNAVNPFPSPVRIQTSWDLNPGRTGSVELVAYFIDPTAALAAGGAARIGAARLQGRMATGLPAAFTAFGGAPVGGTGTAGATLRLFSENVTGANKTRTRTDDLDLRIDLTGQPTLPPGTYTGTLYIRAVTL